MALPTASDNVFPKVIISEAAAPASPSAGQFKLYVDSSDHILKYKNSAGTVVALGTGLSDPMTTRGDIIVRNASNVTARLAVGGANTFLKSDGTDVSWAAGGGGGVTPSYLGYNTVGGSTTAMVANRVYCKLITAGGSGNILLAVQAHIAYTIEAVSTFGFFVFDDNAGAIGDMRELVTDTTSTVGFTSILAHGTGGGISYPYRWFGKPMALELAASTSYWVGVSLLANGGAPNLHHDTSGSDRYYAAGTGPYVGDGGYGGFTQTNSTLKYSIRALVI